jgi:hypothetical protein
MKRLTLIVLILMMFVTCIFAACESESANGTSSAIDESSEISHEESKGESEEISEDSSAESVEGSVEESSEESVEESVEAEASLPEESELEESSEPDEESSEPDEDDSEKEPQRVKLLFARYTQKPIFVMIGTCEQGALVTARLGDQEVTVQSYMGWFEVSLANTSNLQIVDVYFTQTVNGVKQERQTLKARPTEPEYLWTRAIGSNKEFQFFLDLMVPDFEGTNLYNESILNQMKKRVSDRLDQMHKYNKDAEIVYMIVPSPMTTYPELVPERYTKTDGITAFDQITGKLKEAGATVIDLRDTFNKHKNDEMPIYYKLDSHWADYGAYLAYVELFEHISKKFPDAKPRDIDEFKWTADYYTSADACLYLGIPQVQVKEYGYYREFDFADPGNITSVPRYRGMQLIYNDLTCDEKVFTTNRSNLPSCVVYRDSYSAAIYDLIPEKMNKTHYIGMWSYAWQSWTVNNEKPDYVIYIVSEWNAKEIVFN